MTTRTVNLAEVAQQASRGIMLLGQGDDSEPLEHISQGIKLLELLERTQAASQKTLEERTVEEESDYQTVRPLFTKRMVARLLIGQEWKAIVDRGFDATLNALMEKLTREDIKSIAASIVENPGKHAPNQLKVILAFDALSLLLE